jgi:hydroxyacylglutathione hydrolase
MHIHTIAVGPFYSNCHLLHLPQTKDVLLIDPGDEPDILIANLTAAKAQPVAALITHAHLDHIGGLSGLYQVHPLEILLHPADLPLYRCLQDQGRRFGILFNEPPTAVRLVEDDQEIRFGNLSLRALHTPGHTPGGLCWYIPEEKILFSGDTLFAGSIGRTDLEGGDEEQLLNSIRKKLLTLPDETRIFPGHGPQTTVGRERRNNPFLRE